ncbi:LADA_0D04236g1_1 [Lachancea dasiensis]|uniref:LADA_0D04236g1_1 n=1 Tax=Lachancea dasiensis TaxID=1072105 RepID=A0A1G4J5P4_9SACH|nr:LADA_0D04236g1_1 [Lachancea dasiensis]
MSVGVIEVVEDSAVRSALVDSDAEGDELSQDWSHIAKLSKSQVVVPKRGEKDYGPDGTDAQELLLYKARKAMFDSLSDAARGTVIKNLTHAFYVPELHSAFVPKPKGSFMHTIGKVDRKGVCWLTFHELVYLAERGTITPYFKHSERQDHDLDPSLSIEDLYMLFKSPQEADEFAVYAHLKRLGFIVMNSQPRQEMTHREVPKAIPSLFQSFRSLARRQFDIFRTPTYHPLQFHLMRYTSSGQIYDALSKLIPHYVAPKTIQDLQGEKLLTLKEGDSSRSFTFDVWKPQGSFKKKAPGWPDFQVLVVNKNTKDYKFPTYSEMKLLFKNLNTKVDSLVPESLSGKTPPEKGKAQRQSKPVAPHVEQQRRLKKGYRSFILALMDDGLISFVRLTESDFGSEKVWFDPKRSPIIKSNSRNKRKTSSDRSAGK